MQTQSLVAKVNAPNLAHTNNSAASFRSPLSAIQCESTTATKLLYGWSNAFAATSRPSIMARMCRYKGWCHPIHPARRYQVTDILLHENCITEPADSNDDFHIHRQKNGWAHAHPMVKTSSMATKASQNRLQIQEGRQHPPEVQCLQRHELLKALRQRLEPRAAAALATTSVGARSTRTNTLVQHSELPWKEWAIE